MARTLAILLALASALLTSWSAASPSRVVVVGTEEPQLAEAVTRTQAELSVEGFEVVVRDAESPGGDIRRRLAALAREERAIAAISFFIVEQGAAADLWLSDRATDKTVVRTVRVDDVPPAERPRALAIRAVELLRASLVEAVADETADQAPRLPDDATQFVAQRAPLEGVGFQLGVGLLTSFDDVGPAAAPVARISWGHSIGLGARLSIAAPAFGARPTGPVGAATVRQELAGVDLFYAPDLKLDGFLALGWLGAGILHLTADGELEPPLVGRSVERWAAAFQLGAGVGYRLTPYLSLLLDGAAVLTHRRIDITAQGTELGSLGQPSLLASFGVAASF